MLHKDWAEVLDEAPGQEAQGEARGPPGLGFPQPNPPLPVGGQCGHQHNTSNVINNVPLPKNFQLNFDIILYPFPQISFKYEVSI